MNFDMKKFYLIGGILMGIVVLASTFNVFQTWQNLNWAVRVATISSQILFNALLAGLFLYLWRITPKTHLEALQSPEIENLLKQYGEAK